MAQDAQTHDDEFEPIALGSVSTETKGIGGRLRKGTRSHAILQAQPEYPFLSLR